jgi:SAM-dependent methyltransferase
MTATATSPKKWDAEAFRETMDQGGDPDYDQLQQGRLMTRHRHQFAATVVRSGARILDIGCGTALILDTLVAQGRTPAAYYGVDLFPERLEHIAERLARYSLDGGYEATQRSIEESVAWGFAHGLDTVLMLGVFGTKGYSTPADLRRLLATIGRLDLTVALTVPVVWPGHDPAQMYRMSEAELFQALPDDYAASRLHEGLVGISRKPLPGLS